MWVHCILAVIEQLMLPHISTTRTTMTGEVLFVFLCILYWAVSKMTKKDSKEWNVSEVTQRPLHELEDFHRVGFCMSCVKQTRHPMHCDGCGGHNRYNIKESIVRNGETDYICTKCFHLARHSHHCDRCRGQTPIVEIR
jgi:hypothetical protein